MKLSIKNFRKVEKAEIDINTIAFVAGLNEAGKTSITQAMGAALTGSLNVLSVTKKEASALVRDGSAEAMVVLKGNGGETTIHWPSLRMASDGTPPHASQIAAGMVRFCELPPPQAAGVICDVMKAEPTKSDFLDAVIPIVGNEAAEKIWSMIEKQGWDATCLATEEKMRDLKAEWKMATHEAWGSQKGESWVPNGFTPDLESARTEELQQDILNAERNLEEAIAENAVVNSRIAELRKRAAEYPSLAESRLTIEADLAAAKEKFDAANEAFDGLVAPGNERFVTCPHCGAESMFDGHALVHTEITAEEQAEKRTIYEARLKDYKEASRALELAQTARAEIMPKGKAAKEAVDELARLKEEGALPEETEEPDTKMQDFRAAVDLARQRMDRFLRWQRASEAHARIVRAGKTVKELAKDGLRQRKAEEAVKAFNEKHIMPLCNQFGIAPIQIDLDMNVRYRTHLYRMLSESAKFRVNTAIQCAIAKLDGSDCIVVDGADIIVGRDRAGLISMLHGTGIPALVSMSLVNDKSAPDLSAIGGSAYWLESSVTRKIEKEAA